MPSGHACQMPIQCSAAKLKPPLTGTVCNTRPEHKLRLRNPDAEVRPSSTDVNSLRPTSVTNRLSYQRQNPFHADSSCSSGKNFIQAATGIFPSCPAAGPAKLRNAELMEAWGHLRREAKPQTSGNT
eukprot:CAMPEP_0172780994 /NCGR_PEP_ID=MMETSP1074-20121228/203208_1 /TAXON_ID=2916 /ORGANISM="Ceratium fusus, Strain PA161109" /LENGTH=126 /DNA_ID=CAMNT_0013617971 /DNA_START=538 /DNA_END=916 /DNA_ORIENTATION=+